MVRIIFENRFRIYENIQKLESVKTRLPAGLHPDRKPHIHNYLITKIRLSVNDRAFEFFPYKAGIARLPVIASSGQVDNLVLFVKTVKSPVAEKTF